MSSEQKFFRSFAASSPSDRKNLHIGNDSDAAIRSILSALRHTINHYPHINLTLLRSKIIDPYILAHNPKLYSPQLSFQDDNLTLMTTAARAFILERITTYKDRFKFSQPWLFDIAILSDELNLSIHVEEVENNLHDLPKRYLFNPYNESPATHLLTTLILSPTDCWTRAAETTYPQPLPSHANPSTLLQKSVTEMRQWLIKNLSLKELINTYMELEFTEDNNVRRLDEQCGSPKPISFLHEDFLYEEVLNELSVMLVYQNISPETLLQTKTTNVRYTQD